MGSIATTERAVKAVRRIVVVGTCAAILCAAAGALDPSRLALMPLPRQALGSDATTLALAKDSGLDSNADAARNAGAGVTAADLTGYGRITGYTLDYARPATALLAVPGSLEVQTIVERYRDKSTASRGLEFWRTVTRRLSSRTASSGVTVRLSPFQARVDDGAFAFEVTYSRAGAPLVYVGDVVFRTGDLLGSVFVTTSAEAGLRARTISLARSLSDRIHDVLAGKIS